MKVQATTCLRLNIRNYRSHPRVPTHSHQSTTGYLGVARRLLELAQRQDHAASDGLSAVVRWLESNVEPKKYKYNRKNDKTLNVSCDWNAISC